MGAGRVGRYAASLLLAASFPFVVSCTGPGKERVSGTLVPVAERDFGITLPTELPAGATTFRVHNEGPDDHEFILVRMGSGNLPMRGDGLTVNEERLDRQIVASLEPGPPGSTRLLPTTLQPGVYEVFCNMSGHFFGGMHQRVVVQ